MHGDKKSDTLLCGDKKKRIRKKKEEYPKKEFRRSEKKEHAFGRTRMTHHYRMYIHTAEVMLPHIATSGKSSTGVCVTSTASLGVAVDGGERTAAGPSPGSSPPDVRRHLGLHGAG